MMRLNMPSEGRIRVAIALLCAFLVLLPALLLIGPLVDMDEQLFLTINSWYVPGDWDLVLLILTQLGSIEFMVILDAFLFIIGKRRCATYLLIAITSYAILGYGMKLIVDRPRPYAVFPTIYHLNSLFADSFPSGHALGAATVLTMLYKKCPRALVVWVPIAIIVFFTRVLLGMHFPYDVIAGAIIGGLIGYIVGSLEIEDLEDGPPIWSRYRLRERIAMGK